MKTSYKSSGVNINSADKFVARIKSGVRSTHSHEVIQGIGNFGAFYKPRLQKFVNPVFVSSIDGVGTKVKIASILKRFDTIGEDLVNHCVNDIAVCGATPLFFLDYYATGKLDLSSSYQIIKGLIRGCRKNRVALIGGETAEMPGVYGKNDFDLAGAIVGIVSRNNIIDKRDVKKGNVLIGIGSSGLHTNGYSLVRNIFTPKEYKKYYSELKCTLGEELLKVHRSYLDLITQVRKKFMINSISHITGGGIIGNTKRVIASKYNIKLDWNSWQWNPIFKIIMKKGDVPLNDMRRTFNLGIGLVLITPDIEADKIMKFLTEKKENAHIIGKIT